MGYTFVGNIEEIKQQKGAYIGVAYVLCPHCHELMYTTWCCSEDEKKAQRIKMLNTFDLSLHKDDFKRFHAIPDEIRTPVEWCCHCQKKIEFHFGGTRPSAMCNVQFEKYKKDYKIPPKKLTDVFEGFLRQVKRDQASAARYENIEYLTKREKKHKLMDMPKDNAAAIAVVNSPEKLSKYIKALLELEIKLQCAQEYRQKLKLLQAQINVDDVKMFADANSEKFKALECMHEASIQKVKEDGAKELAERLATFTVAPPLKQPEAILKDEDIPPIPRKSDYIKVNAPIPPSMPEYKKPGLFNRKKIDRENSYLAAEYQQAQAKYEEALHRYSCAVQEYEKAIEVRKANINRKKREIKATNKRIEEEYNRELIEYRVQKTQYEDLWTQKTNEAIEQKIAQLKAEFEEQKKEMVQSGSSETEVSRLLKAEITAVEKHIDMLIKSRNTLFAYNVIFPKYRSNSILFILLEYLESGRCTTLSGKDGAYNIYEAEVRADKMIEQLAQITDVLSVINEKQTLLYAEMRATRQLTEKINLSLTKAVQEMQAANINLAGLRDDVIALHDTEQASLETLNKTRSLTDDLVQKTGKISRKMDEVVNNTAVTAHYSAVTAYYSKQTAEITDALGFMLALK